MRCESMFRPYGQGPKGENVGSITQPLPSNYLIFRAASESDGEASCVWFSWDCIIFACSINYSRPQLWVVCWKQSIQPLKTLRVSAGRCWMDALELALSCSGLYKRTAKAGREGDISTSSESSHIFQLLQSTALTDSELLQWVIQTYSFGATHWKP